MAEVKAGRHASVEEVILERLSRNEEPELLAATGMSPDELRRDLDDAWDNQDGAVDEEAVFKRIAAKNKASQRSA